MEPTLLERIVDLYRGCWFWHRWTETGSTRYCRKCYLFQWRILGDDGHSIYWEDIS